jgi:hypothetical protein
MKVTLVVQQTVAGYNTQGEERKHILIDPKWYSVPIMSASQHKIKSVPYLRPLPELLVRAAAGKRCHQVPILYRARERELAAIRLTWPVVAWLAEEGKTALNWRQRLARDLGWAVNLVLKLKRKDMQLTVSFWCNLFQFKIKPYEEKLYKQMIKSINPLTPNDPYRGRTTLLTSKVAFYIFIQQI